MIVKTTIKKIKRQFVTSPQFLSRSPIILRRYDILHRNFISWFFRLGTVLASKGHDYKVPVINNFSDGTNERLLTNRNKRVGTSRGKLNKPKSCFQSPDCDNQVRVTPKCLIFFIN